jgi:hypothetical protein
MLRNTKKNALTFILLLMLAPVLLPLALVAIILAEQLVFRTHYFGSGLDAIGLTPLLQALFNFLGING